MFEKVYVDGEGIGMAHDPVIVKALSSFVDINEYNLMPFLHLVADRVECVPIGEFTNIPAILEDHKDELGVEYSIAKEISDGRVRLGIMAFDISEESSGFGI